MALNNDESTNDFEAKIHISRILKILSDTIKNSEVVLCLPLVMANNCAILRKFFSADQVMFIKETCRQVCHKADDCAKDDVELTFQADMCLVVDLLLSVPELGQMCRETLCDAISPEGASMLRSLEELRTCVAERLKVTPKQEAQQDTELRRLYQQNIRSREDLERLTERLTRLKAETETEIEEKNQLIKQQIDKIVNMRRQCRDNVKKKMDDAERQINWDIKNSECRLEELQSTVKNTQFRREQQLKEHLNTEKDLRAKRYKVESQLVALQQKYDSDIGERQALLEEMTASYEQEKEQMAELKGKFDEQEIEYMNLMYEKEQYERKQLDAKLHDIMCRIAARRIQRWFRRCMALKAKGKKGKKGKKKK